MRTMIALILVGLTACGSPEKECTVPDDGSEPDWIRVVRCEHDYELLWDERTDAVFARTRTINWIIDREDQDRLYFIDTKQWLLHFFFAQAYLQVDGLTPVGTHAEFNILNYRRENRRFVMGKLIHYLDQDLLTLEFSAGDTAEANLIVEAYERVSEAIYDGADLLYRPVSNDHERMLDEIGERIPVIRTQDVFLGQSYQPLNHVEGYGVLRFRRVAELSGLPVGPTDLVILDRVPNDISLVSGIVTDEFQTPLSHVNLLSKNRGTPNMALRGAFDDPELRALDGQLVRLVVGAQDFEIEVADRARAEAFWDSLRPQTPLIPEFDLSVDGVVDLAGKGLSDSISVGAKAAGLAEMGNIEGSAIPLPDSPMALPFAFYWRHLESNGLSDEIATLLAEAPGLALPELRSRLFALRWDIYRAPMNADDLDEVMSALALRYDTGERVRFRSSTNVEDLAEFSGAGLYTSAGSSAEEGREAIENAIKVVWASAWNQQAFVERDFYRVDHARVRMGVLIHPAFTNELANGVAVTINEFASNRPAFYINSQVGEVSVTNPTGQAVPEQILYYTWYEEPEYEVITRSSLLSDWPTWPGGESVLTDAELAELADALERIHQHFLGLYPARSDFAMDVEFKLDSSRQLRIKQARPLVSRH